MSSLLKPAADRGTPTASGSDELIGIELTTLARHVGLGFAVGTAFLILLAWLTH
jgi:hypothetical protein